MPRVNLGRNTANEKLVALIWGQAAVQDLSTTQLAERAKISRTKLYELKKSPEDMTVGELRRIGRALGIQIEDLRAAIRY